MIRSHLRLASLALVCGVALGGCVATNGAGPPGTTAEGWKQIAQGAGQVIGETKADPKIAAAADKVYQYCNVIRPVATGASLFSPDNVKKAAEIARAAVTTLCEEKPRSIKEALVTIAGMYADIMILLAAPRPAPS